MPAHLAAYGTYCHGRRAFDQLEILEQRAKRKYRDEFFGQEELTQDEEFYVDRDWAYSLLGASDEEQGDY